MNTKILGILAIIIIISFFVWPTMYKYDHIKLGDGTYPNRVNRFSGNTEVLVASGWKEMGNNYSSSKEQELPTNEKKKIDGRGQFKDIFGREQYIGEIYNGTTWTLTKVRLSIIAKESDGKIRWERKYEANCYVAPLSSGSISINVLDIKGIGECDVKLDDAFGYPGKN